MKVADLEKTHSLGEFVFKNVFIPILVSCALGIPGGIAIVHRIGESDASREAHFTTLDNNVVDVKKTIGDVRQEQVEVRKDLAVEHDRIRDIDNANRSVAADLLAGRAQTHARVDALEQQSRTISELLATIKQTVIDNKEVTTALVGSLNQHSEDLAAIREKLGATKPRDR